jgi:hypothetical protein
MYSKAGRAEAGKQASKAPTIGWERRQSGLQRRTRGEEAIEPFTQRRVERRRGWERGNFQSRKYCEGVGNILCARAKERNPHLRAQEARGDLKPSNCITNTKRAERGNPSKIGRKGSFLALLKEARQRAESTLGVVEVGSHRVSGAHNPGIGGASEIKEKLNPRSTPIQRVHLLRPRQLGPVPLDRRQGLRRGTRRARQMDAG